MLPYEFTLNDAPEHKYYQYIQYLSIMSHTKHEFEILVNKMNQKMNTEVKNVHTNINQNQIATISR